LGVTIPAPNTGDLLGRVRERIAHPFFIQTSQRGGSGGAAERGARALGAAVRGAHQVWSQREEKAATEIVAERDGGEQLQSRSAFPLRHGESRGHDGATRVRLGDRLEVICLV